MSTQKCSPAARGLSESVVRQAPRIILESVLVESCTYSIARLFPLETTFSEMRTPVVGVTPLRMIRKHNLMARHRGRHRLRSANPCERSIHRDDAPTKKRTKPKTTPHSAACMGSKALNSALKRSVRARSSSTGTAQAFQSARSGQPASAAMTSLPKLSGCRSP